MCKSEVVYSYNKMLPAIRVNKQFLHPATWVNLTNIRFRKKKTDVKKNILYDSIYMKFKNRLTNLWS